ncbi:MAG: hypothetical protein K0S32_468 [Bacteroidetes bacterium]|jgi:hypothetical protein|nr:hypothetical protein [Bacteroidota bacterium]
MINIDLKNKWDTYIKYILGFSIIAFCTYILASDVTFLIFNKKTTTQELILDDGKTISFKYHNSTQNKVISIEKMTIKNSQEYTNGFTEVFYNPYFSEDVYFFPKDFPSWGQIILLVFGMIVIYIITTHKW